ncbi:nuclear receptor subfamily 2 group E member 1 [Coccinella septempunctata]|uniref:nuclear receptor subfamily 2 group E member 1 n=1 Tax=Coccinella septempunctata TaxID=41139 RepID=UPI001D08F4A0|nr:nuclear receptor subfamily 2 group E member 1 [Coccinella septempunctata]
MLSSGGSLSSTPDNTMFQRMDTSTQQQGKGRILDIPCRVCGDFSSGKHYNIFACDGCAGFFKRSIRRDRKYTCKAKEVGSCIIDKVHRNQCRACRLKKCEEAGMNKDAVQHERGPRNSTLKKQQMNFITEANARLMMTPPQTNFGNPPALPPTPPMIPHQIPAQPALEEPTVSIICESAARLLFMNVQWARNVPSFVALPLQDQLQLLEHSWRDLFILSIAQFLPLLDLTGGYFGRTASQSPAFQREVHDFQEILSKLNQMLLDPNEFQTLRTVVLFRATINLEDKASRPELNNLLERQRILQLQDEHLTNLNGYISATHMEQPLRFTKLMLILPHMKKVSNFTIEELFFRKTIGSIPIVNIICDMYRNQAAAR